MIGAAAQCRVESAALSQYALQLPIITGMRWTSTPEPTLAIPLHANPLWLAQRWPWAVRFSTQQHHSTESDGFAANSNLLR